MTPDCSDPARRALVLGSLGVPLLARASPPGAEQAVPILVYHRFATSVLDGMTVRADDFESHLRLLDRLECKVIALSDWVAWRRGELASLPARAVVLTADDGHRSQFEVMAPMLKARGWPVTLFVYPSAISNASYAMTWQHLRELVAMTGWDVQSHTYWHPNFLHEERRLSADAFHAFAADQLRRSSMALQARLSRPVSLLAWPFGLSDARLQSQAVEAGYRAAFSLGNRSATARDPLYAVPRHLIVDGVSDKQLARRLEAAFSERAAS